MLYSSSNYSFGDFSNNPTLDYLTTDPRKYASTLFMPNEHDRMVIHLRNWIHSKAGGGVKWGPATASQPLPSRLPNKEIFDVYNGHTKHCTDCMAALKFVNHFRNVAVVMAALSIAMLESPELRVMSSFSFSGLAAGAERLKTFFYTYEYSHQNNN